MSLEIATYISQLIATNPTGQDKVAKGDDHIRLIKASLQNTFPNIEGAMTASHTALSAVPENIATVLAALVLAVMPRGSIVPFDWINNPVVPTGWALCDGSIVGDYGVVPDLRGVFLKGWEPSVPAGTLAGIRTQTSGSSGTHSHLASGGPHTLTEAEIPPHSHALKNYPSNTGSIIRAPSTFTSNQSQDGVAATEVTGGGTSHTHDEAATSSDGAHTHVVDIDPPHYTTVFIVKVTAYDPS